MRARLLFVTIASAGAVSAATACSSPDVAAESEAKRATQASAVSVSMFDKAGASLGTCSGTLVAKDVVLTAGHCAAGAAKWSITARGADATSEANRAVTPWKAFGSDLSHPDHADVALLILDTPIALDSYPAIATSKLADGAKALRFSRASTSAGEPASSEIAVSSMTKKGFRLNYAAKIDKGAFLDTGGAIIDPKTGKIHGVVSGVGNESGLLHIARTDNFAKWITHAKSCASATSLATRTYGTSSGGSSGGSSSWGGGGSSSWGGGSGDWGGYGGSGDKLDGGGASSGSSGSMDGGAGSSGAPGSSSGASGSSGTSGTAGSSSGSSGSSGTSGSAGAGGSDTSGAGSSCPGVPSCEGNDCPGGQGGGDPGSGSSGTSGSSGSDGTNGGGAEVCPGPPNCPEPDSQACSGAACGGCGGVAGCVDATIDYGNCASCGSSAGTGTSPVVR